ncbi:exodeoxyribonuclease III [Candidatus Albibeggiatoa sp. nov. BB20]|uniref:exodeoxyribonuclease III n=1 Tax=Candidatus Albibeggiatoa sp. nov. BB20 TaxID=3162723 RepID=UPI00336534F4
MRIITANVNGIRAAAKKGFFDWLAPQQADFVCIQETKAQIDQLSDQIFHPQGYHCFYHDAQKKGYSGVAVYSRQQPQQVKHGIGWEELDCEGRYLEVQFKNISVVSLYMHSGSSGTERQDLKYQFMDKFLPYLQARQQENLVICGDWNIAHKQIDLKNWRPNQKNSGFLPEERAWMDQLLDETGYVDAFRQVNQEPHQYTWWSNRGQAWANNTGWRIDYQVITESLRETVQTASIYKEQRFSDHSPLIIDYDFSL